MSLKVNVGLSLAAGLLGGLLSQYLGPQLVHAQNKSVPPEVRAQSFVLVNDAGVTAGTFGFDENGNATVVLKDKAGKVIWSSNGRASARPLTISGEK
jgi:hypothetical protein